MELQYLVHFNRTLCVRLTSSAATVSRITSIIQQQECVPSSLLDLYVNGRKLNLSSQIPSFPTIIRARLRGGLRGGKGGFGAMLRIMGKASGSRATTDFGACRDLHGRRLRHVNQEVAMHKWHQDAESRNKRKAADEDREIIEEETPSGIPGWYLATPSWAEGIKKSYMKTRRNTILCKSWLKAREGGRSPPIGAPRWWGCPRGRDCTFAHGEEELRGKALTELKRVKRDEAQRVKQQQLQEYVDFEQELPDDVLDAIRNGLRRKKKADVTIEQLQLDARILPPDATTYARVRSVNPLPVVEKWLQSVEEEIAIASVATTFKHGLCELRGRGNFVTASSRHCCALTKGKWYYEVRLVTAGIVQIGWADSTFVASSATGDGVGDHDRSWAYDGARQVKWNGGKNEPYATDEVWSRNDVIGCLLDLDEGTVSFSRNGLDLGVAYRNVKPLASDQGFYPAISVEQTEILLVNIGSQPFLHQASHFKPVIDALEPVRLADEAVDTSFVKDPGNCAGIGETDHSATVSTENQHEESFMGKNETKISEKEVNFTHPPIDLMEFETIESFEALGLERLKVELSRRGLKCGGNLTERAARLFSVRGKAWDDIDAKMKVKKNI
ncbi:hypothetical protein L915_15440 [Plasmopara halstedii]|uniref:Uncharacterized protein n=1 Tax=Plasmopara halstedii TaxID=4781 RepID=A0A0P1AAW7_PLAHL|nr:hypothetical protein L915_15440 [Plasmopara halstedii]CEG37942.1 hypothetical protein L915_15440 [Plasmopara halstedii]|eukprot:XP_024574311.1 hypothetical protein L915_15440 [Plasmopara halstedii]